MLPDGRSRIGAFDGLRALAVGGVILTHFWSNAEYVKLLRVGPLGVQLFFVLSGFLITGILLKARREAEASSTSLWHVWRAFIARRFLRIVPPYALLLAGLAYWDVATIRSTFWWHATYLTNYWIIEHGWAATPVGHFWSLAVEEQFYIVWPFLILWLPWRRLPTLFLGLIPIAFLARLITWWFNGTDAAILVPLISNVDAFGAGGWLAWQWQQQRNGPHALIGVLGFALIWIHSDYDYPGNLVWANSGMVAFCVWLIDRVGRAQHGFGLGLWPLRQLGQISYGIYLMHVIAWLIVWRIAPWADWPGPSAGLAGFVAFWSIVFASASWFLIEAPLLSLKRFFPYVPK